MVAQLMKLGGLSFNNVNSDIKTSNGNPAPFFYRLVLRLPGSKSPTLNKTKHQNLTIICNFLKSDLTIGVF